MLAGNANAGYVEFTHIMEDSKVFPTFSRKFGDYISMLLLNMCRKFRFSLILAMLISIILEITLFNYTHYGTLFTSKNFSIAYNKQERHFDSNRKDDYYLFNGISIKDSLLLPDSWSELRFRNLNTEIASIYINPIFIREDKQRVRVIWADEESSKRSIDVSIIKGLDFSNYITITPRGKVSNLTIKFLENNIAIKQIELNKTIPMAIMPIRLVIVFGISLLLLCLKNAELREKISYFCFDYLYDKASFKQRAGFALLVCSMLIFNFLASYSVYGFKDNEFAIEQLKMYSHHMTDALLKKQLHLDLEVPRALLEAERPYDYVYREQHGIFFNESTNYSNNLILDDYTYYKGKYYSYFGMLPVILLFAPYKLLTGNYLPNSIGVFLFASIATVLLMLIWKQIAQNYLKKIPYFFFLIGGATLYASSLIPIYLMLSYFYLIPQYSALAFVFFGIIMLFRANESGAINRTTTYLFISSFSFALAVACRPSYLFWSILIPVLLWDKRKEINVSKALAIIIPFAIVGSILAWYNYARFDTPFSFGYEYMLAFMMDQAKYNQISIIGKIYSSIRVILFTLFNPPNLDLTFPFVTAKVSNLPLAKSTFMFYDIIELVGIFCFPILWFLFYVKKIDILRNFIFVGIFISALNILLFASHMYFMEWRYNMDYSWIITIGALICAFQLQEREAAMRKVILKTFYLCCTFTCLLSFFFTISVGMYFFVWGRNLDSKIYYYLTRTFGVICNVP